MKTRRTLFAGCLLALLAALILAFALSGRRPYRDLRASDIASAAVHLVPPDETVELTDCEELAGYLKELVVWRESNEVKEYCGQMVAFSLTMKDGSREELMVSAPFLVINGTEYKAAQGPCEALERYANRALEDTTK